MKNYKNIALLVVLFCVNDAFAGMYRVSPPTTALTLQTILSNPMILGTAYTGKAKAINSYNYANAESVGYASLAGMLDRGITNINSNTYLDQMAKINNIKATIDSLYNDLSKYHAISAEVEANNTRRLSVERPLPTRPLPSLPVVSVAAPVLTAQSILNGALGQDYASKAKEIYNSGVPMYVNDLDKRINALNQGRDAANNIKNNIDTVYRFLQNSLRNNQPVAQVPVYTSTTSAAAPALTFQSILNGALGQDYASKANEVYNSGVSSYVDALVKDINRDLNSSYHDESVRARAIKASIDRNYNFLAKYRRNNQY